jgi:intracellular sulfur oxidation DsrE/DsrF family protein
MHKLILSSALLLLSGAALAQTGGLRVLADNVDFQTGMEGVIAAQLNTLVGNHVTVLIRDGQVQNLTRGSRHVRDVDFATSRGVLIYVCSQDLEQYEVDKGSLLSGVTVIDTGLSAKTEPVSDTEEESKSTANQPSVESVARRIGAVPLARQLAGACLR